MMRTETRRCGDDVSYYSLRVLEHRHHGRIALVQEIGRGRSPASGFGEGTAILTLAPLAFAVTQDG